MSFMLFSSSNSIELIRMYLKHQTLANCSRLDWASCAKKIPGVSVL